jgi:hypothetical protein
MKKTYQPIDLARIKTYSIRTRDNKVNVKEHFAGILRPGVVRGFDAFREF